MAKDYYKALGVSEDATLDEIKRQYRKLAKKHHPDHNKGDKDAEARFKDISEAYEVLKDENKRAEYDALRKYGAFAGATHAGGFDPGAFGGGFDFSPFGKSGRWTFRSGGGAAPDDLGDLNDILASLFSRGAGPAKGPGHEFGRQGGPRAGADLVARLTISFLEAVNGTTRMLSLPSSGKKLSVKIPAGIDDGGRIRLRGQGEPGLYGGPNGDLIVTVIVMPHQQFTRKGNDIYSSVEISFVEAVTGCSRQVKTLTKTVSLTIPAGTQPGTRLRLKGMGLAVGAVRGDQYVEVKVKIPKTLTARQRKLLEDFEKDE
ncbi:MAG TPA: J domain-containing protein [Acidobacteriota bacterium]|nr:J domain-containing protein [Acidobacteriota bacterium]